MSVENDREQIERLVREGVYAHAGGAHATGPGPRGICAVQGCGRRSYLRPIAGELRCPRHRYQEEKE